MAYLIAALAATAAGPLLYRLLHERPRAMRLVDGFVYLAVPILVAWQIVPDAWRSRSVLPLVAVAIGAAVPTLLERASHAFAHRTDAVALVVGLSGLLLHAPLDGAALAPQGGTATADPRLLAVGAPLALAIIVHRVAEGLLIWWLLHPRHGSALASLGVAGLMCATVVGYVLGLELLGQVDGVWIGLYRALVAGSLLHVVFHQGRHDHAHG